MSKLAIKVYALIDDFYQQVFDQMANLAVLTKTSSDMKSLADTAYACNKAAELIHQLEIRLKAISALAQKMACVITIQEDHETDIVGEYCVASPDMKMMPAIPKRKKEYEDFAKLMEALGVSKELWDTTTQEGVVRVHYPGLVEHIQKILAEGKKLPEGLQEKTMYPIYNLKMRKGKKTLRE